MCWPARTWRLGPSFASRLRGPALPLPGNACAPPQKPAARLGKGDIEHLLEAEKELGVWRTKIEETEGELRYYSNVIALSTLRISLAEMEIRAAAALTETERTIASVTIFKRPVASDIGNSDVVV